MKVEDIVMLLKEKIGVNPDSIGHDAIKKVICNSMEEHGVESVALYYSTLTQDDAALQDLIESVVIPETLFFRDKQPFEAIKENVALLRRVLCDDGEPIRILSIPSSTGEEPYSIAISCVEAGLNAEEFEIYAFDISNRALRIAEEARYGDYSFRGCEPSYKERYFQYKDGYYHVNREIRDPVRFFHGNLIEETFLNSLEKSNFHIIFCRNLLIYFDRTTKIKAMNIISELLHDDGLLVVGHADTAMLPSLGYKRFSQKYSFTYIRGDSCLKPYEDVNQRLKIRGKELIQTLSESRRLHAEKNRKSEKKSCEKTRLTKKACYQQIEILIDSNNFVDAEDLCKEYIADFSDDGEIYHYLGVVLYVQDKYDVAEEAFKKAVYLHPGDESALLYLAEIARNRGETAVAERYEQRAARIKSRTMSK